jgi:glucosamine kinase
MSNTLIAESGSSKTDWTILEPNGNKTQFQTAGISPFYQSTAEITAEITQNVAPNINVPITQIHYYGTGLVNHATHQSIAQALQASFDTANINTQNDLTAAARALCQQQPGIACILGTGANSCLYNGSDIIQQIPPLGFWLGDEGSGGYLGKTLIISYLRQELPPDITEKLESKFGVLERTFILEKAYREPFPNRYFASFSKFIWQQRRHPYIYKLVYDAFSVFIEKNILKYHNYNQYQIHFVGSVAFYYSDILRKVLEKYQLHMGVIAESPTPGLILYHKNC